MLRSKSLDAGISAVNQYLDQQGDSFLKGVFDKFADVSILIPGSKPTIKTEGLQHALLELGVHMAREKVEALVTAMDIDESGSLDFEEFKLAVQQQPTQLEQWASMLPLAGMLARSLPVSGGQGDISLREFSKLEENEVNTAVEVFSEGLRRLLMQAKDTLRQMFNNVDKRASEAENSAVAKFKSFKMSTGKVADYHRGLSSRIGTFNCRCLQLHVHSKSLHG